MSDRAEHRRVAAAKRVRTKREGWISLAVAAATALGVRVVLDLAFSLPQGAEWAVALVAAVMVGGAARLMFVRVREIKAEKLPQV